MPVTLFDCLLLINQPSNHIIEIKLNLLFESDASHVLCMDLICDKKPYQCAIVGLDLNIARHWFAGYQAGGGGQIKISPRRTVCHFQGHSGRLFVIQQLSSAPRKNIFFISLLIGFYNDFKLADIFPQFINKYKDFLS